MVNMRKNWNTTTFMAGVKANEQRLMKVIALRAKDIGRTQFQGIAPQHSDPGEYPAEQSGSMKQAFDAEVFMGAGSAYTRFGIFGTNATKTPPDGDTPVGVYARKLALGDRSQNLDPRPWHLIVINLLEREHWEDII